jgi:hypothetical protein
MIYKKTKFQHFIKATVFLIPGNFACLRKFLYPLQKLEVTGGVLGKYFDLLNGKGKNNW